MTPDLHCPKPQALPAPPYDLADLDPLLQSLRSRERTEQKHTFPRGTLQPDGRLDMCKQNLGIEGCRRISTALRGHPHVRSLMLGTDAIGDAGALYVSEMVRDTPNLETLYLGCNAIGPVGAGLLAEAVENSPHVKALWLKRNPLGDAGALRLASMLRRAPHLKLLDLVHTQLSFEGLSAIVTALAEHTGLERLYLGGNALGPGAGDLLAFLLRHRSLPLKALLLNVNHLGDEGVRLLMDGMLDNHSLQELGLGSNGITSAGALPIARMLSSHPSLQRLELGRSPSTRVLGAVENRLGDEGVGPLARGMMQCPTLRHIELDHNAISVECQQQDLTAGVRSSRVASMKIESPAPSLLAALDHNRQLYGDSAVPEALAMIKSVYR